MRSGLYTPNEVIIPGIQGNPNGNFDSKRGDLVVDTLEPALWMKTTEEGTLTGWVKIGSVSGGGGTWRVWQDTHADDNPPVDITLAVERRFRNGDSPVVWDPQSGTWN